MNEDFVLVKGEDKPFIANDLNLVTNKKLYDIRKRCKVLQENGEEVTRCRRLWLSYANVQLKYGYSESPYKPGTGSVVMMLDDNLSQIVQAIDDFVREEFLALYTGTVINNVAITANAVKQMFKSSMYDDGALRINVSPQTCAVFRSDGALVEDSDLHKRFIGSLKTDVSTGVIFEPSFASVYQNKIRIHWDARQFKLAKLDFKTIANNSNKKGSLFRSSSKGSLTPSIQTNGISSSVKRSGDLDNASEALKKALGLTRESGMCSMFKKSKKNPPRKEAEKKESSQSIFSQLSDSD